MSYENLIRRFKEYSTLASCAAVLEWDERTYMPHDGSAHRAEQLGLLARLSHEMLTAPEVGALLADAEKADLAKDAHSVAGANIREIRRAYDRAIKLPKDLVEEMARVTSQAQQVWQEARQKNDFVAFAPWLEKIIGLKRREADAVGYREAPYDALLDAYEPGATASEITRTFAELRQGVVPLVQAIAASPRRPRKEILEREFPIDCQQILGEAAAAAIGFDFVAGRLDVTTHPFCTGLGPGDCRITTRYNMRHFNDAFFGTLHEAGHGIYEQGLEAEHFGTPVGSAISLGIHESQSRMWENLVGRSRPFWEHFFPRVRQVFPAAVRDVSLDDFVFAINTVEPSFIRVEADEVTYNMHIILRFELEQVLIRGDLKARDVPTAWNEKYQQYLGITPPTDAFGCLQDVHWSAGLLGYFPTYALGNMYAAQFMDQARHDLGDLDADFRRGHFDRLKTWLNDKIHRPGQRFRAGEICINVTGKPLSHQPLLAYLRGKFGRLYGL